MSSAFYEKGREMLQRHWEEWLNTPEGAEYLAEEERMAAQVNGPVAPWTPREWQDEVLEFPVLTKTRTLLWLAAGAFLLGLWFGGRR